MLSGTEILIAGVFVVAVTLMATIDAAFSNVSKVAVRLLVDGPRGKTASSLAALLEERAEAVTSIHIVIQLLLVAAAVLLFTALEWRPIPYTAAVIATVVVMMFAILIFRHLIP